MRVKTFMGNEGIIRIYDNGDADEEAIKNFHATFDPIAKEIDRAFSRMIWRESKIVWFYWKWTALQFKIQKMVKKCRL